MDNICQKCEHPCLSCSDIDTCDTCVNLNNRNNAPYCTCSDGYYENSDLNCVKCPYPCDYCETNDYGITIECTTCGAFSNI